MHFICAGVRDAMIIRTNHPTGDTISGAASQQIMKDQNTMLLLNLIRKRAPISRADLARTTKLSPATVSILVEELLADQWISETAAAMPRGERGRRPIMLSLNASRGYIAILELLNDGFRCTLYDICLHKVASERIRKIATTAQEILDTLLHLLKSQQITTERLLGIHTLFPGLFDATTGHLVFSAVMDERDMVQRDLVAVLRRRLPHTHVMISNDATMVAYSQFIAENQQAVTPLLALTIHEGINAGIVMDGQSCLPVEAGHIIIDQNGPLCRCFNHGCLETYCSTPALFRRIRESTALPLEFQDTYGADCNQQAMELVAEAYHQGDAAVCAVLEDYAYTLCCGIISIVNLFAVRSVHIGGSVYTLGEPFLQLIRKTLDQRFHVVTTSRQLSLELFDDDYESSRKAAVILCMEHLFQNN